MRIGAHSGRINTILPIDNGRLLYGGDDGNLWSWSPGLIEDPIRLLDGDEPIMRLFQASDESIWLATQRGTVSRFDPWSPQSSTTVLENEGWIRSILEVGSDKLAIGGQSGVVSYLEPDGSIISTIDLGSRGRIWSMLALADGTILVGQDDGWVSSVSFSENALLSGFTSRVHTDAVKDLIQLSDGRIASTSDDHSLAIWDVEHPERADSVEAHGDWVWAADEVSENVIASAGGDGTVALWAVGPDGIDILYRVDLGSSVRDVTSTGDGYLVASTKEGRVWRWTPDDPVDAERQQEALVSGNE